MVEERQRRHDDMAMMMPRAAQPPGVARGARRRRGGGWGCRAKGARGWPRKPTATTMRSPAARSHWRGLKPGASASGTVRASGVAPRLNEKRWTLSGDGRPEARPRAAADERRTPRNDETMRRADPMKEREGGPRAGSAPPNNPAGPARGTPKKKEKGIAKKNI